MGDGTQLLVKKPQYNTYYKLISDMMNKYQK